MTELVARTRLLMPERPTFGGLDDHLLRLL